MDRLVSNNSLLGRCVKTLYVHIIPSIKEDQLIKIDKLFPQLQELQLFEVDKSMFSFFYKMIIEDGKFCSLKTIPKPLNGVQCDDLYLNCLMLLKHRIAYISFFVYYHGVLDEIDTVAYDYLNDKLSQFPNLKRLALYIEHEEESSFFFSDHLECLTKNGITSVEEYSLELYNLSTSSVAPYSTENLKSTSSIVPAVNVKHLRLETASDDEGFSPTILPNDEFMLYIMNKFPNLNSIYLHNSLDKGPAYNFLAQKLDYKHISKTIAFKFLKHVFKLSNSVVKNFITSSGDNTVKIIQGLYSDFKENSTLPTSRYLEILYDERRPITSRNEHLRAVFIDLDVQQTVHKILIRPISGDTAQLFQQNVDLIKQTGRFFTHIELEINNSDYLTLLFKHIAEELSLPRNYNIKALTLKGSLPSLEQLECIIGQLPSLEALSFHISSYLKRGGILSRASSSSIFLPNTSLKCLELYVDTIVPSLLIDITGHYLKLITESNEKARYCLLNKEYNNGYHDDGYKVISNSMEDRFKENVQNKSISTLQIYCKSVEKFTIKYHSPSMPVKMEEKNLFSEDSSSNE